MSRIIPLARPTLIVPQYQSRPVRSGPPPPSGGSGLYTTSFPGTENPMVEDGLWVQGGAVGGSWTNVRTTPGQAFGTQGNGGLLDDSVAHRGGAWNADQEAEGVAFVGGAGTREIELLLRFLITAGNARGYEVDFSLGGTLAVARWNGALGDFTPLNPTAAVNVATGDRLRARMVGNLISCFKNDVPVLQVTDSTWATGAPGLGLFRRNDGNVSSDFGWTSWTGRNL